jgi:hypothetical protein
MFDMASLTKVIATTTAAMMLEEQGQLDLDRTVVSYLPEFNAPDKAAITLRMLLTHRGDSKHLRRCSEHSKAGSSTCSRSICVRSDPRRTRKWFTATGI